MKEFYKIADRVLMIRTSNPVVRRIKKGNENEEEIIEDRILIDEEIANHFKKIHKRPEHMREEPVIDEEMKGADPSEEGMNIDTTSEIFLL